MPFDGDPNTIVYTPPQVCADFMVSQAFFRLIAGPVGSGKTTACIFELYRRAAEQVPGPDGLRHTRFAIVRQTLQQLKQTVLKDILAWLPGIASWRVSESTIYVQVGDIRSEWLLIPLDNIEDQRRLLSSQLTGAWLSECIEMDFALIAPLSGRCGRYPGANQGGCTWQGIIADTNMPEEGSMWHEAMEINTPADWLVFIQPGGLTEKAENLNWLTQSPETLALPEEHPDRVAAGRKYYERLVSLNRLSPAWIKRYVHAQYGIDPSGSAVFAATFQKAIHVVHSIEPIYSMLVIGQDFGRDPCSVICQMNARGGLSVLQEIMADDIGLQVHLRNNVRPVLMQPRYQFRPVVFIGDPAGKAKSTLFEINEFDLIKSEGWMAWPAPTNDPDARIRAVEYFLLMMGGMQIDGELCPSLVRAMNGGYRYKKSKPEGNGLPGENKATPNKNNYSHIADALQYAALACQGGTLGALQMRMGMGRNIQRDAPPRISARAWS